MGTKWEQVGTRTPKWRKNGNKVGDKVGTRTQKWEQELVSGTRMGTKLEQERKSGTRMGTK